MSKTNDGGGVGTATDSLSGANMDTLKAKLWDALETVVLDAVPYFSPTDIRWSIKNVADHMVDFIMHAQEAHQARLAKEKHDGC